MYKKAAVWIVLIAALCTVFYSLYKICEIQLLYAAGDQKYEELQERVTIVEEEQSTSASTSGAGESIFPLVVDFKALEQISEDTVAWLYCPDTVINYPVMWADDYDWYLHHLPDGTYHVNGSLFLDYNCAQDFSGNLSIIYGHNMKSGKMFHSLKKYKKQAYFEEHPYMYLYTGEGNYRIDLMYGCVIGAGEWRERAFMYEINLNSLMSYAAVRTTFKSNVSYTEGSQVIALSTCSYEFDDARYVVLGILVPEYENAAR
ncbi:MAG TPA: class B sortase [Clostridiales bacterium]|nr:class B sortase [Clostridiales bacterium]